MERSIVDNLERKNAADDVITYTATNGGGTFDRKTLRPVEFRSGYAVAIDPTASRTISVAAYGGDIVAAILDTLTASDAPYIGTWIDNGDLVIDAVIVMSCLADALEVGRAFSQDAVYSFGQKEAIPC